MPFKPGDAKRGGRQKGVLNKDKRGVREIVEAVLGRTIPEALIEIAQADPRRREDILLGLMPYAYPKLQAMAITGDISVNEQPTDEVKAMAEEIKALTSIQ